MKFEKKQYTWKCSYFANTTVRNGTHRRIEGNFEGAGDVVGLCELELNKRLKKPHIWFGVGITIITPLGQKIERVIESRHYGVMLVEG